MATVFKNKILKKEFEELHQKIIPFLNECGNCNILKCHRCLTFNLNCKSCRLWRCKNCRLFRNSKWLLFEKCNAQKWNYVINFLHDFFRLSDYTFDFFSDLKPLILKVKDRNEVFIYER